MLIRDIWNVKTAKQVYYMAHYPVGCKEGGKKTKEAPTVSLIFVSLKHRYPIAANMIKY